MTRTALATDDFDDRDWLSTRKAAEALGITSRQLYKLIDSGVIPAYRFGRVIRLRARDIRRYGTGSTST